MKAAVVSGASSGIGEATARRLAADGWRVLVVARREERLQKLCGELGGGALYVAGDLTDPETARRVAEVAERELGDLQLLVNNAGGNRQRGDFTEVGTEYIREVMEQNFFSALYLTEALLPLLRRSSPSSIVNVSSIAGRLSRPKVSAYHAAKFALAGWNDSLRIEEKPHGVHIGLVLPGFVSTEGFTQEYLTESRKTRWMVSSLDKVVGAILDAGPGGRAEVPVPRPWGWLVKLRYLAPSIVRRATG